MQIANDVHKLRVLTQLHIQINQGNLFCVTNRLDYPYCEDVTGNHSRRDLRALAMYDFSHQDGLKAGHLRLGCWIQDVVLRIQGAGTQIQWIHPKIVRKLGAQTAKLLLINLTRGWLETGLLISYWHPLRIWYLNLGDSSDQQPTRGHSLHMQGSQCLDLTTVSPHLIASVGSATLSKTTYNKTNFTLGSLM